MNSPSHEPAGSSSSSSSFSSSKIQEERGRGGGRERFPASRDSLATILPFIPGPRGEGESSSARRRQKRAGNSSRGASLFPLPRGEGKGEGNLDSCRCGYLGTQDAARAITDQARGRDDRARSMRSNKCSMRFPSRPSAPVQAHSCNRVRGRALAFFHAAGEYLSRPAPVRVMKQFAPGLLFLAVAASTNGQGTVNFANLYASSPNAPVYEADGITPLSGSQFIAELLGGPSVSDLASIATTGFLQGAGAGYFNGGVQAINTVPPQSTAWVKIRVWNTASGSSFQQAQASGLPNSWWQSATFSIFTGGGFQGPEPAPLTALGNSRVYLNSIPEPSALALFVGGLALSGLRKGLTNR